MSSSSQGYQAETFSQILELMIFGFQSFDAKPRINCDFFIKAESPYRFITFALPTLAAVGYLGKKVSLATIIWLVLICQCALMVPQVSEKVTQISSSHSNYFKFSGQ